MILDLTGFEKAKVEPCSAAVPVQVPALSLKYSAFTPIST